MTLVLPAYLLYGYANWLVNDREGADMQDQADISGEPKDVLDGDSSVAPELPHIKFGANGLLPCIVQEWTMGEVLVLVYVNAESIRRILEAGTTWFFGRSRRDYWSKGATSGHIQKVHKLRYDRDGGTLLALAEQTGAGCYIGDFTCFGGRWLGRPTGGRPPFLADRER